MSSLLHISSVLFAVTFSLTSKQLLAEIPSSFTVGAIGDSISTAFNSTGWGDRKRDSWTMGTSSRFVTSHYQRLRASMGNKVKAYNMARTGAKVNDMVRQAKSLAQYKPDYVTFMGGGNDICAWSNDRDANYSKFTSDITRALNWIIDSNKKVKILMVPIPNLKKLWEVSRQKNSCQWIWDTLAICKPLLHRDRTNEERNAFQQRWQKANEQLSQIAGQFKENVLYNSDLTKIAFEWNDISSRDCFHPSDSGQAKLASKTWDTGWFAKTSR